ncbi:MAG: HNH endonuclease, partial [Solirubrobacterales bacterium]
MSAPSRPGRCWFCGNEHLAVGDPPEHIVQAALGGTLTTDRVARECNSELSKSIDKPFLDDFFIALQRVFFDIRDPRRRQDRPPPNPRHEGELADGTPIKVEMRGAPWQPIIEPRLLQDDEKVFRITAPTIEAAEAMMEKKLKRLQRDGVDVSSLSIQNVENKEAVEAKINVSIDG